MSKKESRLKILLVDDHPENLIALQAVLDSPEYHLVKAKNGMEALKLLLKEDFGLILLDVNMPGLNGFETAAMIRERPKTRHIPIIFVTAVNKSEADAARGYSLGAIDYIIKPFEPEILRTKVAALTELSYKGKEWKQKIESVRERERKEMERKIARLEKVSQERYRNLAHAIPHILWIAGPDGRIDFFNQQWFSLTGLTFEQSEGWGWKRAIHPEDLPDYLNRWEKTLKDAVFFEIQYRLKRTDGVYRWHLVRALPEKEEGQTVAWVGTSTEIDDQKRLEEALKEATRLKSEFVSNVSHELRTPLNAILGYTSLLLQETYGPIHESQKTPVEGVHSNASELLDLINDLLDLSKIESGKMSLVIEPIHLMRLLPKTLKDVKSLMSGKEIAIRYEIQEDLHVIQSDRSKVRQIFLNLLSNAIKFTKKGSITISAVNVRGGIQFSIQDTGIGMKPQDLPHIFAPFRQIDGSMTREAGGSGLGLTIVRDLVRILQGRIDVQSEFGVGSTFTVFLPEVPPVPSN
ncbi:MAG: ATP-binding protein [Candidatus Manganitrophus sp. SA1]|nr:ATP-binding protein [Candidatus Manganitrophus morganii]